MTFDNLWQKIYKWENNTTRNEVFSIDTPPPTVSGQLHMGHIFSYSNLDAIARYQRMKGMNVFFPLGFDDNGLPTERLVEKIHNIKSKQLLKKDFIDLCQKTLPQFEDEFESLFKQMGFSFDFSLKYQTVSAKTAFISQMSFLDLYKKGYIVRREGPVFWDIVDGTAIAQTEIEDKEKEGILYYINYNIDQNETITIATTRPELIPVCVAILVHPDDQRYNRLIGFKATTPFFNKQIPIIADEDVKIDKGSGAVMCCTFGDIQDITWWQRHQLPLIEVIDKQGRMYNADFLNGLTVKQARNDIVARLNDDNLIINIENTVQFVKCAERSGAVLEIISTPQWYIKVMSIKDQIMEKSNQCHWYPPFMEVRLKNWVEGLNQDWCISRQRHFGIKFPVWYSKRAGEEGKILLPQQIYPEMTLPKGYSADEVEEDNDVMDTWATSALTPQIMSQKINDEYKLPNDIHDKIFPFDLRPQAHEIIRVWTFGTLVKSLYHHNSIPWKNIMISGWCLASDGSKMSKSKGNSTGPMALLEEHGADVIRYWASTTKLGNDLLLSQEQFKIGKKLVNKLKNAIGFLAIHINKIQPESFQNDLQYITNDVDLWFLSEFTSMCKKITAAFEVFDYFNARLLAEQFFWSLCDNYLEMIKERLYKQSDTTHGKSALFTLYYLLLQILKLFAPFLPYTTEELYQKYFQPFDDKESIHQRNQWPNIMLEHDLNQGRTVLEVIEMVRRYKSQHKLSIAVSLKQIKIDTHIMMSNDFLQDLQSTIKCNNIIFTKLDDQSIIGNSCKLSIDYELSTTV